MAVNLKGKSFLTLMDLTPQEIRYLLDLGRDLKSKRRAGVCDPILKGKHIVLLFEKTSTRTRCSFEVAATQEGAHVTYLDAGSSQMGKKESLEDSAKVLGRFFDGIEYRGYAQKAVEDLAKWSGVPVWNGLTDWDHPTQILADMMTLEEHCDKPLNRMKVVFPGDVRNNMCYAWMIGAAKMGMHFVACAPKSYMPNQELIDVCQLIARETGAVLEFIEDPLAAVQNADVLYTDVWVSMGEPVQVWEERIAALAPYQVTKTLMDAAGPQCRFMHCLPAYHDRRTQVGREMGERFGRDAMEVSDEVFESRQSIVFDEAENRMHTIKAVMYSLMK